MSHNSPTRSVRSSATVRVDFTTCIQPHTSMPALKNLKHEAFARNVGIHGMSAAEAYRTGWPNCSEATAETTGPKLARDSQINLRIMEFREEAAKRAAEKDFLTVEEKRAFLAKIVRTPLGEVTKDSELCQEWSLTDGERTTTERIKMPSKLDAIKIDNDLATDGAQAVGNKAVADALPDLAAVVASIFKPKA